MEPVGLAVGIVGLAGLYTACLDLLERFDSWKEFGTDSKSLSALFNAEKLRLRQWGDAAGFDRENLSLSQSHHKALDNPQTLSIVKELLSAIKDVVNDGENFPCEPDSTHDKEKGSAKRNTHPGAGRESKRGKLRWALGKKGKRVAQVEQFGSLVEKLCNLVPTNIPSGWEELDADGENYIAHLKDIITRIEQEIEAETKRDIKFWILGSYSANEIYDKCIEKRLEGTGDWILKQQSFCDWYSPDFGCGISKLLWIHGPAGFGKSFLCARVIQHLSSELNAPVAYFFVNSDHEARKDPFLAIRFWVTQLIFIPAVFQLVYDIWAQQDTQYARRTEVVKILHEISQVLPGCAFVLDGLDECTWVGNDWELDDRDSVADFLKAVQQAVKNTATRILIFSRDEPMIRQGLTIDVEGILRFDHKITPEDVQLDTTHFSKSIVEKYLSKKGKQIKEEASEKLASRCKGQFLWLKLQEHPLKHWKNHRYFDKIIDETPSGLESLYKRNWETMASLPDTERTRAFSLLRWVAFALRPLTIYEITEALLIEEGCEHLKIDEMPDMIDEEYIDSQILGLCGSLLEVQGPGADHVGTRTIHLAHFSVKQYIMSNIPVPGKLIWTNATLKRSTEAIENTMLARMCLHYLSFPNPQLESIKVDPEQALGSFRGYASGFWYQHVTAGNQSDIGLTELIKSLFDEENPKWEEWRGWFDSNNSDINALPAQNEAIVCGTPLFYAAWLGLTETARALIKSRKHGLNETAFAGWTPLYSASRSGHPGVVKLLLENEANTAIPDSTGLTPLIIAASRGHIDVVKALIERGATVNVVGNAEGTPLTEAIFGHHIDVINCLLKEGADVNFKGTSDGVPPLIEAVWDHHIDVVELLIENGADINLTEDGGGTALLTAVSENCLDIAELLVRKGANINTADDDGWTPLLTAAFDGHFNIIKIFIEKGADVHISEKDGWTPLNAACSSGSIEIVKLLLQNEAVVDFATTDMRTPLITAIANKHIPIVELLLKEGADINFSGNNGSTPLMAAAADGCVEGVRLLLQQGADITITDKDGSTPLHAACGQAGVVKLLLEHGANPNVANRWGTTPLNKNASMGYAGVVQLLLNNSADLNVADNQQSTPLHNASVNGYLEVVDILLQSGADTTVTDNLGYTPVMVAAVCGRTDIAERLLSQDVDINTRSKAGWTALMSASVAGCVDMVKLFIRRGADTTVCDTVGWTALHVAALRGHHDVAREIIHYPGVMIDTKDRTGRTPLFLAARKGCTEAVEALLSSKASPYIKDRYGATAIFAAARNGHETVVKRLLEFQDGMDFEDGLGRGLVWWAKKSSNVCVVQLLLEYSQKTGIAISQEDLDMESRLVPLVDSVAWCDVCTRPAPETIQYFCKSCDDFLVCLECYEIGGRCLDHPDDLTAEDPQDVVLEPLDDGVQYHAWTQPVAGAS